MYDGAIDRPVKVRISGSEWKTQRIQADLEKGIDIFTKPLDARVEAWEKYH